MKKQQEIHKGKKPSHINRPPHHRRIQKQIEQHYPIQSPPPLTFSLLSLSLFASDRRRAPPPRPEIAVAGDAAEEPGVEGGPREEAEDRGGQDLRAQEQEQEQERPKVRPEPPTIRPTQARSQQGRR